MQVELDVAEEEPFVADMVADELVAAEQRHSPHKSLNSISLSKLFWHVTVGVSKIASITYYKYTFFPLLSIGAVPFEALVEHTVVALLAALFVAVLQAEVADQHMPLKQGEYVLQHTLVVSYMKDSFALGSYMDSINCFKKYSSELFFEATITYKMDLII